MDYLDYLKEHENFDKFILFLLALGETPTSAAKKCGVSRSTVYDVIDRNQTLVEDFYIAVKEVLDGLEEPNKDTSA